MNFEKIPHRIKSRITGKSRVPKTLEDFPGLRGCLLLPETSYYDTSARFKIVAAPERAVFPEVEESPNRSQMPAHTVYAKDIIGKYTYLPLDNVEIGRKPWPTPKSWGRTMYCNNLGLPTPDRPEEWDEFFIYTSAENLRDTIFSEPQKQQHKEDP